MNIGIDVGGTNLKAGLVDDEGRLLAVCRTPLEFHGGEAFVQTLAELALQVMAEGGVSAEQIGSVGMGIPGAVSDGNVLYTANIPLKNVPLSKLFRRRLDLPLVLGNDADCAAVGEYYCGAGRGTKNFAVVTLGTGIGGGLILGGRLYTGMGMGGEVGHMVIRHDGLGCNCGRRGCWERYASATGLITLTKQAMEENADSLLHTVAEENGTVDGRTPFAAAQRGDMAAQTVCRQYAEYLADGVTNLINLLQPEILAIGGGVAAAPDALLLEPLRERVRQECIGRHTGRYTQIVRAELGNDAGIIGAALLHRAV